MTTTFKFAASDKPLSIGEKAALTQGLSIITPSQLAALYLIAKHRIAKKQDKSTTFAGQVAQKMNRKLDKEDFRHATYARLSDMLDMNPITVTRTVNKFMHLLLGTEIASEVLYAKIVDAFSELEKAKEVEIMSLATESLNFNADTNTSDEYNEKLSVRGKESRMNAEKLDKKKRFEIKDLFLALKLRMEPTMAAKKTAEKLALTYNVTTEDIKKLARLEFKNDTVMLKYWK